MDPAWPVLRRLVSLGGQNITPYYCCCLLFISHELIRYKSSRGHKIDGTKPNQTGTRSEKSRESRQKTTDNTVVASKRHRRHVGRDTEETEKRRKRFKQETETQIKAHTNKRQPHNNTLLSRLRQKGSPISGGIQPGHEDKSKGNGCDTQRKKNTEGGKGDSNQVK